jgi:hypothetical protein
MEKVSKDVLGNKRDEEKLDVFLAKKSFTFWAV